MADLKCPECESANVCGHEVRGVYDGVLFWSCLDCITAWSRDWSGYGNRQEQADMYAAWFNAANAQGHKSHKESTR